MCMCMCVCVDEPTGGTMAPTLASMNRFVYYICACYT